MGYPEDDTCMERMVESTIPFPDFFSRMPDPDKRGFNPPGHCLGATTSDVIVCEDGTVYTDKTAGPANMSRNG